MNTAFSGSITRDPLFPQVPYSPVSRRQASESGSHDKAAIGLLTPEKTQALLNREIADKLQQRFKAEGVELKGLQAEDYTPEKVSERILGFVSPRILAGEDQQQQSELMAQARKGIEQGFAEAREILDSLDVLNGKVKDDVDSTYDLIQQGLEKLQQQIDGTLPENDQNQDSVTQLQQAEVVNSYSRNENTRVEITTRDGDTVVIDLSRQQSAASRQNFQRSEQGFSYSVERSLSASAGLSYQVQGELDEGEQQAIDELLNDIAKVSDSFFSGNVQKAFKTALDMDFDSDELSRLSLNLDYRETRQAAISTYSEYQSQSQSDGGNKSSAVPAGLQDMSDFIKQMDQLFENPFAAHKFAHPGQGIGELFNGVNQLLHSSEMKQLEQDSSALLGSLVEQIKQLHSGDLNNDASEHQEALA